MNSSDPVIRDYRTGKYNQEELERHNALVRYLTGVVIPKMTARCERALIEVDTFYFAPDNDNEKGLVISLDESGMNKLSVIACEEEDCDGIRLVIETLFYSYGDIKCNCEGIDPKYDELVGECWWPTTKALFDAVEKVAYKHVPQRHNEIVCAVLEKYR